MSVDERQDPQTLAKVENGPSIQEPPAPRASKLKHVNFVALGFIVGYIIISRGINSRARATSAVTAETRELAVPTVAVIQPKGGDPSE